MKNANIFVDVDLTLVDAEGSLMDGAREALDKEIPVVIFFYGPPPGQNTSVELPAA